MILPFAHHIVVLRKWKIYSKVWKAICFRFPAITSDIAPKMYLVWKVSVSPSARVSNIEKPLEWKIRPLRNCQGANYMVICLESRYQTRLKISFHIFISLWSRKLNEDFTKYTRIEKGGQRIINSRSSTDKYDLDSSFWVALMDGPKSRRGGMIPPLALACPFMQAMVCLIVEICKWWTRNIAT